MMTAHTKGPWTIVPYGDGDSLVIHSSDENRVCFMATHGGTQSQWERIQANARLIAAAPELYGALRYIANETMHLHGLAHVSGTALAALSKATGKD